MELISELGDSLNGHFKWNKARRTCFVQMLLVLFTTRTVNLNKLACVISSKAVDQSSRYRRLQRYNTVTTNTPGEKAWIRFFRA